MTTKITLYQGSCLDFMRTMENADVCITDPPYGIGAEKGTSGFGSSKHTVRHYKDVWTKPTKEMFDLILSTSQKVLIFGGNYFTDVLPQSNCWMVWDKTGEIKFKNPFSDCELIWTNLGRKTVKKYLRVLQGFIGKEKERWHPTQKPLDLMVKIIEDNSQEGDVVFDPFMGSGTTGVACVQANRSFIGCEIDAKYFKIAKRRIGIAQLEKAKES